MWPARASFARYHCDCMLRGSRRSFLLGVAEVMSVLFGACGTYHDHSGRDDDIRAVYSWALSHSELRDATLLVSPEILHTAPDDRCLGIPRSNLAQMHTDFERHKQTSKA